VGEGIAQKAVVKFGAGPLAVTGIITAVGMNGVLKPWSGQSERTQIISILQFCHGWSVVSIGGILSSQIPCCSGRTKF
jgi:hypothetical protein